jgi:hypothetical protein
MKDPGQARRRRPRTRAPERDPRRSAARGVRRRVRHTDERAGYLSRMGPGPIGSIG